MSHATRDFRRISAISLAVAVPLATATAAMGQGESFARYRLIHRSTWSAGTHPVDFPLDAHYSRLVGATHTADAHLWMPGELATPGVGDVAMTGRTTRIVDEIAALDAQGHIGVQILGPRIAQSPGEVAMSFETSRDFPLVSVITMIAPSPDWIVGSQSLELRDENGWIDYIVIDLWPYDSGDDSGITFASPNEPTVPPEPIARIADIFPFTGSPRLGTFTFNLINVTCTADFDDDGELGIFDFLAFQNAFDAGEIAADIDGDGDLTLFDFLAFQNAFDSGC